ncbi:hypothetical protein MBLNU459_g7552t1 [Dothideomycetes sp. NU459]
MSSSTQSSVVILGAGIIGCSTAYYLAQSDSSLARSIHLVDSSPELFASASGKAGGFLAADWFGPSVSPLGALSFKLHKDLANQHNGRMKWGYSSSTGASLSQSPYPTRSDGRRKRGDDWLRDGSSRAEVAGESDENGNASRDKMEAIHRFDEGDGPAWLTRQDGDEFEVIAKNETVAQVDPLRLCEFLLSESNALGVSIHNPAKAISICRDSSGRLSGVKLQKSNGAEVELPCTHLLLAAGAWTPRVFKSLFPSSKLALPISSLAGHSIVIKSPRWTDSHKSSGCHAVFTTSSNGFSPELISRIGGEIYVAGLNDADLPLPEIATEAEINNRAIEELKRTGQRLCGLQDGGADDLEVLREGLCFRPVTDRGTPILGRLRDEEVGLAKAEDTLSGEAGGVFVAAGHGPWGISLSLGTGLVMGEMMMGRNTSASVGRLSL